YAQGELDKLLVLALAGDRTAGLYAIAMRIIDLTATPIRSFNQLLVQKLMADRKQALQLGRMVLFEGTIAAVSTLGLIAFIVLLGFFPGALGANVAQIAPLLPLLLAVPALRNLIEYHGELLYARNLAVRRFWLLSVLTILKLGLMAALLARGGGAEAWAIPLNGVYLALYAVSLLALVLSLRRGVS
ncbi:MAG: lipopolysaccharide biosynthesis protein, partial [Beijerinckiaceae bacterium]